MLGCEIFIWMDLQKLKKDAVSREGRQKGKSSRMVELKPGQQEGSDIKYTLTSQIIHNIFTEFPSGMPSKKGGRNDILLLMMIG